MKSLTLILLLLALIGCSRKNTKSTDIQTFQTEDTVKVIPEDPQDKPFTFVEQMPSFPGGEAEMHKFIMNHYKYPPVSYEQGEQGRIIVKFVVSKTGEIKDIEAVRGGLRCDSLISVVKRMPRWIPGKQRGEAVDVYYTLPMHISPARR